MARRVCAARRGRPTAVVVGGSGSYREDLTTDEAPIEATWVLLWLCRGVPVASQTLCGQAVIEMGPTAREKEAARSLAQQARGPAEDRPWALWLPVWRPTDGGAVGGTEHSGGMKGGEGVCWTFSLSGKGRTRTGTSGTGRGGVMGQRVTSPIVTIGCSDRTSLRTYERTRGSY